MLQKICENGLGVKSLFVFSLGRYSKQAGDERDLVCDVSLPHAVHLPLSPTLFRNAGKSAIADGADARVSTGVKRHRSPQR